MGNQLTQLRINSLYRVYTQYLQQYTPQSKKLKIILIFLCLYIIKQTIGIRLFQYIARNHYERHAHKPKLIYQSTDKNLKLLSRCYTITKEKYYPKWYLFNGHIQTITVLFSNILCKHPIINYQRQLLELPDGGSISLDWALPNGGIFPTDLQPNKRTMLVLAGLTGGSSEHYIRSTVDQMLQLNWQVVVANARGCENTELITAKLFSCAYTDDLRYVVQYLNEKYQFHQEAFVAVGFSMGSNVLVKYLGEEMHQCGLTGGISIGNPFNLILCNKNFESTLFYRLTYDKALTFGLKQLFFNLSNAHEVFKDYPGLDFQKLRNAKTLREFDDLLTKIAFGYNSVEDYYIDGSSDTYVSHVTVPLLCINAEDDPISIPGAIPYVGARANPNVIVCVTKSGGHLAFYSENPSKKLIASRKIRNTGEWSPIWSVNAIAEFAESLRISKLQQPVASVL